MSTKSFVYKYLSWHILIVEILLVATFLRRNILKSAVLWLYTIGKSSRDATPTLNISGRKTFPLVYDSRTKGKESGIQCLEVDGRKRTVVGAHPIINGRKEMAIVSNEPGDVATTGERI